ncbi:RNA-binding protein CP33 [Spatholobus suberectus]|nr:RNA-binding protein CP33 [Spatholobus suberectus]
MAATASACSRICNMSLSFNFPHRAISLKPLNLKPPLLGPSPFSLYQLPLPSVSLQQHPEPQTLQKPEPNASHSNQSRRLYVENLPYSLPSSQLAQLFGEAGNVVSVEIVYDDLMDRSRGFAFVTMGSVEEAERAIRMFDGSEIGGRIIKVNFTVIPKRGKRLVMDSSYRGFVDSPHKIYAGNLGWGLTSQGLRYAFAEQPGFLSAKVIYERNSGKSQGYGFVSFETAEDVEAALNSMNGVEVQGRLLRLNLAVDKKTYLLQ